MRIWFYRLSEFTPWDIKRYGERKFRYTMLAEALVDAGHEVMWWTDDFQHFKKDKGHRFGKDHHEEVAPGITIRWIHSPGYNRNISFKRFINHRIVAGKMLEDADNWPKPDLILCAMPTDTITETAVYVGERYQIPVVLDVRDQWPDIFFSQVNPILRPAVWIATRKMKKRVMNSFARAQAVTGNTDSFVDWGLSMGNRDRTGFDRAFPIGYSKSSNNNHDEDASEKFWRQWGVHTEDGSFKVCFLGMISKMYDFSPVLKAAKKLAADRNPVKFILCGDGPGLKSMARLSEGLPNIIFPGRISGNEIHALLKFSSAGIIPYINHENFGNNIANKPAEYLSAKLPILISVGGNLTDLLNDYSCGGQYQSSDELVDQIRLLRDDPQMLSAQREGARRLFSERLDADKVYKEFASHLEFVGNSCKN